MELLLLSNSTLPGKAWLEHALPLIANQLNGRRSAVFIPFAGVTQTWDEYTDKNRRGTCAIRDKRHRDSSCRRSACGD
ncbi:peptidase E [Salmonella enterica subsp. enterica]|uniref:Peptidase E n=1 Tax=Salmonella enterica I TaxID=59201 RepID=A0A447TQ24_SALET|nr:peptidase E [Salmonella enterica subsp. enterica]